MHDAIELAPNVGWSQKEPDFGNLELSDQPCHQAMEFHALRGTQATTNVAA
jgi:hypothetical protein